MLRLIKNRFVTRDPIVFEDSDKGIIITQKGSRYCLWLDDGYLSFDDEKHQYTAVFECPFIKNIVLSGAGSRGVMYPGVIEALEEFTTYGDCQHLTPAETNQQFLDQVETFSCASIGAVVGSLVAAGMRSQELKEITDKLDFEQLLGKGWTITNPVTKKILLEIYRDGMPLRDLMRQHISGSIYTSLTDFAQRKGFDNIRVLLETEGRTLEGHDQVALQKLAIELNKLKNNQPPAIITFSMLHALHCLYPVTFKDIYFSVTCCDTQEVYYLSADSSPDLEIAIGGHASAAVPTYLNPVEIEKKYLLFYKDKPEVRDVLHFADGGYFDNSPYTAVDTRQKKKIGSNVGAFNQNLQTLVVIPDDTKAAEYEDGTDEVLAISAAPVPKKYQQSPLLNARSFSSDELAPSSFLVDLILNFGPRLVGLVLYYTKIREETLFKLRKEFSQRIIPINSKVKFLDFEKAQTDKYEIMAKSKEKTLDYLKNHHLECVYFSYNKISDLIKNLSDEKYLWLKKHRNSIPMLKKIDFRKIDNLREKQRQIPVSLWPRYNNFMRNFYEIDKTLPPTHLIERLRKHFYIISTDESASDDVKMLRALSAIFDNLDELSYTTDGMGLLSFFTNQFGRYIRALGVENTLDAGDGKINTAAITKHHTKEIKVTKLIAENIKTKFFTTHQFHVVYQRIVFILQQTKSSIINSEDLHQRPFLETILNDIKDLATLSMNEANKLKKLEEYVYESYLKVLFFKGSDKSNLIQALKRIIQSSELLNLPYLYGIKLPTYLKKYPVNMALDSKKTRDLDILKETKLDDFFKTFDNLMEFVTNHAFKNCTLKSLLDKTPLFINYDSQKKQSIYQIVIKTLLSSPIEDDRFYAKKLSEKITSYDYEKDKVVKPSLFFAVTLLTRLMWIKPTQQEATIYNDLLKEVSQFVYHYTDDSNNNFAELLNIYLNELIKIYKVDIFSLFKYHSQFFKTLKEIRMSLEQNETHIHAHTMH